MAYSTDEYIDKQKSQREQPHFLFEAEGHELASAQRPETRQTQ
jgi:hypothetical protein